MLGKVLATALAVVALAAQKPQFDPPTVTVVGDSLRIGQTLDHLKLATLDSFSLEMPYTAGNEFPIPVPGPFTAPPTGSVMILAPPEGVTWTGNFCARAWRTGTDSVSKRGPRDCGPSWSYTGPTPPAPVDTMPPGAVIFPSDPTVVVIAGDGTLPPPDSTPPDTTTPPPPDTTPPLPPDTTAHAPELPRIFIDTDTPPVELRVVAVAVGGLQGAMGSAQCGDALVLAAGSEHVGNFTLRPKLCQDNPVIIRTDGVIPPRGQRISHADSAEMATLYAITSAPVVKTADGTQGWYLSGLRVLNRSPLWSFGRSQTWSAIDLYGSTAWTTDTTILPSHITLDHVIVQGAPDQNMWRCVTVGARYLVVIDSYLAGCHELGSDSQAIGGWGGTGPYKFKNNYFEGAGENVMFGGTRVRGDTLNTPSDIEIVENYFAKPLAWNPMHPSFTPIPGTCSSQPCRWTVKNLFEIKEAKRVLFERNLLEYNWPDAQAGKHAILFQAVDSALAMIRDVTVRDNIIAYAPGTMAFCTTKRGAPPCERIAVVNNLWLMSQPLDGSTIRKAGYQVFGARSEWFTIEHNTLLWPGTTGNAFLIIEGLNKIGTRATNNVVCQINYMVSTSGAVNQPALDKTDPLAVVAGNVMFDATPIPVSQRPPGNTYVTTDCTVSSIDEALADFSLLPDASAYTGTDGRTPGVDVTRLPNVSRIRSGR